MLHPTILIFGFLGLLAGSHICVVIQRWPHYASAAFGRSRCDTCAYRLSPLELIPLFAMLYLRGRCRTCSARIPAIHWQVELLSLAIGVAAAFASDPYHAAAGALFGWQLLAIGGIDATRLLLPNILNALLALTGLISAALGYGPPLVDCLIGGCVGFLALFVVRETYRRVRHREGLGGGDPKLLGAIGCWIGWQSLPALLFLASILGLTFVVWKRIRGERIAADHRLPFGTMLATAAYLTWLAEHI